MSEHMFGAATDPKNWNEEQLRYALELAMNFFGDYHRGAFRGGEMSWDDLDATHEVAASSLPLLEAMALEYWGREYFDERMHAAEGSDRPYKEWLNEQLEEFRE